MKTCTQCGESKPLDDFYKRGNRPGGYSRCKACDNGERLEWRRKNGARSRATANSWHKRNPDKVRDYNRRQSLRVRYGMTLEDYERLFEEQKGVCAICREPCKTGWHLAVDHDHHTGEVRGLLCARCNRAIGNLGNDPKRLERAAAYLRGDL